MELQRRFADGLSVLLTYAGGANFTRALVAALVLGDIVKGRAFGRDDLDRAQTAPAENRDRDLGAVYLLLDDDAVAILKDIAQGGFQLLARVRQLHADGRAAVHDLHRAGQRQRIEEAGYIVLTVDDLAPRCGADTVAVHDALGNGLIHCHRAAEGAGAGIGNAEQIERSLNFAVLAVSAVQAKKDTVRKRAYLKHVPAEAARALELARCLDRFEVGRFSFDRDAAAEAVGDVEGVLKRAVIIFKPHEHIDEYSLMAEAAQGFAHGGARDESDLALGAYPAA